MTVVRLITDGDILAGRVLGPLVLDPQTLITPAARDRAVAQGMVIIERAQEAGLPSSAGSAPASSAGRPGAKLPCPGRCDGGCDPGCPGGCGAGASGLAALGDGLFLVRIAGGHMVSVHRAAETGPCPGNPAPA